MWVVDIKGYVLYKEVGYERIGKCKCCEDSCIQIVVERIGFSICGGLWGLQRFRGMLIVTKIYICSNPRIRANT